MFLVNEYYKFLFPISFVFLFVRDICLLWEEGGGGFSGIILIVCNLLFLFLEGFFKECN